MAPPLGRQDSIFSIELHAKLRHGSPLCKLGVSFDYTKGMFGPFVLGLHPFFFCSAPNFGRKIGLILGENLFFLLFT